MQWFACRPLNINIIDLIPNHSVPYTSYDFASDDQQNIDCGFIQIQERVSNLSYVEPTTYILSESPLQMDIALYFNTSKHKTTT